VHCIIISRRCACTIISRRCGCTLYDHISQMCMCIVWSYLTDVHVHVWSYLTDVHVHCMIISRRCACACMIISRRCACACMIISRRILFKRITFLKKLRRVKQNTHFAFNNVLPKIMLFVREGIRTRQSQTDHRWQYDACALSTGYLSLQTHTHSEYVIFVAFKREKWIFQHASMLRFHVYWLSCSINITE
jgi:hypothetical protein